MQYCRGKLPTLFCICSVRGSTTPNKARTNTQGKLYENRYVMAKILTDIFFKGRVDNLVFYRLHDMMVLRTSSGFTKETRNTNPRYENCNRSASEFGCVSTLGKQVRMVLSKVLPKQNNLAVVNSFTKKMCTVVVHDITNPKGERQLANAVVTENGRQLLQGYEFNPHTQIVLGCQLTNNSLTITTKNISFPKGIRQLGFRMHRLAFDFVTGANVLVSGEWVMENDTVTLEVPVLPDASGVVFTLLETQFFEDAKGHYLPFIDDVGKSVMVVGVG